MKTENRPCLLRGLAMDKSLRCPNFMASILKPLSVHFFTIILEGRNCLCEWGNSDALKLYNLLGHTLSLCPSTLPPTPTPSWTPTAQCYIIWTAHLNVLHLPLEFSFHLALNFYSQLSLYSQPGKWFLPKVWNALCLEGYSYFEVIPREIRESFFHTFFQIPSACFHRYLCQTRSKPHFQWVIRKNF